VSQVSHKYGLGQFQFLQESQIFLAVSRLNFVSQDGIGHSDVGSGSPNSWPFLLRPNHDVELVAHTNTTRCGLVRGDLFRSPFCKFNSFAKNSKFDIDITELIRLSKMNYIPQDP
jgi:hypothetical protein